MVARCFAHAVANFVKRQVAFSKILFNQLVVGFGGGFYQRHPGFGGRLFQLGRQVGAVFPGAIIRLHRQQVNDAAEVGFGADRHHHRNKFIFREAVAQALQRAFVVGVLAVQLVNRDDDRLLVDLGVLPGQLGANLDARDRVHHHQHRVGHANGALHFALEVAVTRRIKNVDLMIFELDRNQRGREGQTAVAFFLVPVGDGTFFFNAPKSVDRAGVV